MAMGESFVLDRLGELPDMSSSPLPMPPRREYFGLFSASAKLEATDIGEVVQEQPSTGIYAAEALESRGAKRRMTLDEGRPWQKARRTVGAARLHHSGGLRQETNSDVECQLSSGLDDRIGRTITWYNRWGELPAAIRYEEIKDVFAALPVSEGLKILKEFEPFSTKVSNPTSWLHKAAWRKVGSAGVHSSSESGDTTANFQLRNTISGYNSSGKLTTPISVDECMPYLTQLDFPTALHILKGVGEKGPTISSPTGWIIGAARTAGAWNLGPELDYRIGRTIAWYNRWGDLQARIRYDEIKHVFAALPGLEGFKILKEFEPVSTKVSNPTSWLYKAAEIRLADAGAHEGGEKSDTTTSDTLRKTLGWYNSSGNLQTPIIIENCMPHLADLDLRDALDILKGLDEKGPTIKSPTGWIIGAARKASSWKFTGFPSAPSPG